MEFWVLLAAAGSGYLAHRWQNLHKSKEASSDTSDDNDSHSGSSWGTLSSRGTYCHRASSNRRYKASSYQNRHVSKLNDRHVSKLNDSVGSTPVGCAPYLSNSIGVVEVMDRAEASQYGIILDICSCSKTSMHSQTGLDAVGCCLTNTKNNTVNSPRCPALHMCNDFCVCNCCGFDFPYQTCKGYGIMSAEAILGKRYSSYCTEASATDGSGSMLRDELPLKLTCDAQDDDMANEEEAFLYDEKLMLGFLNASEGTFVLETSSSFMVQEHEGRRKTNNRKVRSHQKNSRRRRGRNHLPSISSESCFLAQLDDVCSKRGESNIHSSSASERSSKGLEERSGNELADAVVSGSILTEELLSASRHQSVKVSNTRRKSVADKEADGSAHWPCFILQSSRRGQVKAPRESSASPGGDHFLLQGTDSVMKTLLFNFGVGVGMMFAILSNNHGTMQSMGPLEATLCSLKELEAEVHGLMFECYQTNDAREDALAERTNELFTLVMRIFDAVERVRNFLPQNLACISAMDLKHSKERAKLEAELEAELEKMEVDLSIGDLGRIISNGSENDLIIGNIIQGELSTRGLPCDDESIREIGSGADFCYEIIQPGKFAVSAIELAMRLHEVLDARQEREILELEAEVKHLDGRLQAKEEELQVWKQRVQHLLQGGFGDSFPSFEEKDVCVETAKKVCRAREPCHNSAGKCCSASDSSLSSRCNEHLISSSKEACSLHLRVPQHIPCLTRDADDEVLDQFLSGTKTGSPCSSPKCLSINAHAKDIGNSGMPMSHQDLKLTGFLRDATDDTPDNSPCFVKFIDKHTILHHNSENKVEHKEEIEALIGKNFSTSDRFEEVVPTCKAISYSRHKPPVCTQDVIEISKNYAQSRHALASDWSMSEDSSYSSDLDEQLGQMLIKRIVEKSKRGSLIVEVAQSAMASFDND